MLDTTSSTVQYRGDGEQSVFPVPFPFLETSHVRAHAAENGGGTRALAAGIDYSVTRTGDGGELTLLTGALPAGAVLTIRRLLPLTQEILFHNQGPNSPRAIEEAIDKLTMIAQQLNDGGIASAPSGEGGAGAFGPGSGSGSASSERLEAVERALAAKAALEHFHSAADVSGLYAALALKADADSVSRSLAMKADAAALEGKASVAALAAKADRAELAGRAGVVHGHEMHDVAGLAAALNEKLDADDPRLDAGGGGTADHALLANRDAAGQHPQSAIVNLTADLTDIRTGIAGLARTDGALAGTIAATDGKVNAVDGKVAAMEEKLQSVDGLEEKLEAVSGMEEKLQAVGAMEERVRTAEAASAIAMAIALSTRVTAMEEELRALAGGVDTARAEAAGLTDRMDGLGGMAGAADAPADDLRYVRQNRAWVEAAAAPSGGGPGGGTFVGDIRLLPFRAGSLPGGWYFCGGGALDLATPQGRALAELPESFKTDWGIAVSGNFVSLPNLFDPETGSGLFPRAVNSAARLPGSVQTDAIRNITGSYSYAPLVGMVATKMSTKSPLSGAFTTFSNTLTRSYGIAAALNTGGENSVGDLSFDASLSVPTAEENRPVNIGMTPGIYLGV